MIPADVTVPKGFIPPKHAVPTGNSAEVSQQVDRTKQNEERAEWCKRYDAAQPSGHSLSVNSPEFVAILKTLNKPSPREDKKAELSSEDDSAEVAKQKTVRKRKTLRQRIASLF